MYHALLTNRYLTTRVIPFIAVAAVALCTALVIIVVSIMSGFVDMVRSAGQTLMGDVIISYPIRGIPYYERLIADIEALPEADAATPVVDSWGLLKLPYDDTEVVQVWAVEPESFAQVTGYEEAIHWRPPDDALWLEALENATEEYWEDLKVDAASGFSEVITPAYLEGIAERTSDPIRRTLLVITPEEKHEAIVSLERSAMRERLPELLSIPDRWDAWDELRVREPLLLDLSRVYEAGSTLSDPSNPDEPGAVLGIHISRANKRRGDGTYEILGNGSLWMPGSEVTLTMLPIASGGTVADNPATRILPVANEVQFGIYQIDDKRVFIPLAVGQQMLELDEAEITDPDEIDPETLEPKVIGTTSARANLILIDAAEGVDPATLKEQVERVYDALRGAVADEGLTPGMPDRELRVSIRTWEEQNAEFIAPVEKERNLMRILFSIIYFVCAGLVLVIFWAIVYEKTRDIGILRSIGASRLGILWIFVRYGMVVGVAGSVVGLGLAYLVVHNINHIHNALGHPFPVWAWGSVFLAALVAGGVTVSFMIRQTILPVVVSGLVTIALFGAAAAMRMHGGFLVWDPKVYYFTEIPNHIDMASAAGTMIGAVFFSIVGALIPAARAGDIDPVSSLRYE